VTQQLRESFPDHSAFRYLIYDNDSIFSDEVKDVIESFGIKSKRTAYRSPWQNGTAERGSVPSPVEKGNGVTFRVDKPNRRKGDRRATP